MGGAVSDSEAEGGHQKQDAVARRRKRRRGVQGGFEIIDDFTSSSAFECGERGGSLPDLSAGAPMASRGPPPARALLQVIYRSSSAQTFSSCWLQ
jgi:hypothetical protein